MAPVTDIERYIAAAPAPAQERLTQLRLLGQERCPNATEVISYQMPAFREGRVFFYYAAFKAHIGVYPPVKEPAALVAALAPWRGPKGNLQFPHDAPMPWDLITQVIDALHASYAKMK
jgi:uncharacterized protein YdhG (YjbR/CyaY superfamily)